MRRIATVALATGVALAGLGAEATTADAATHKWNTAKSGFSNIYASGSYTRTTKSVSVSGYLRDYAPDGRSPGVQFKAVKITKTYIYTQRSNQFFFISSKTGKPLDYKFPKAYSYGHFFTSKYLTHLYVREISVNASNRQDTYPKNVKTGWKKIY
ncbi:MAG: hypothetical protein JWN52_6672 [Actinomycetia bacterium]|nr:hypothetical protein [Actinomycetes bacterium]